MSNVSTKRLLLTHSVMVPGHFDPAFCVSFWYHLVFCVNSDFVFVFMVGFGV